MPPQLRFVGQLPKASSPDAIAQLSYNASDMSGVALLCRLSVEAPTTGQGTVIAMQEEGPDLNTAVTLDQWMACNSSITFYWLLPGKQAICTGRVHALIEVPAVIHPKRDIYFVDLAGTCDHAHGIHS